MNIINGAKYMGQSVLYNKYLIYLFIMQKFKSLC